MKKFIALALFLILITSGAFAMDKAIGGGLLFNHSKTSGTFKNLLYAGDKWDWTMSRNGFGGFAFFGLGRFIELNFGIMYKNPQELSLESSYGSGTRKAKDAGLEGTSALQFGVYFKYPFVLTDRFVLFPTAGIDYELTLSTDDWWDDLWLRLGAGVDFFLGERVFLRGHFIYGVGVPIGEDYLNLKITHGLLIKVGIGFMF